MTFINKAMFDDPISHAPQTAGSPGSAEEKPKTPSGRQKVVIKKPISQLVQSSERPDFNPEGRVYCITII